jgi:hypothetical protein
MRKIRNLRRGVQTVTKTLIWNHKLSMKLVRSEVFTAVTIKNAVLWNKKPQFLPHSGHITSPLESSRLMLCKIWGFHSGHYEEFRLLGYKSPVRTSQQTHCVSATGPSRLMQCKIWGFSRRWLNAIFWDIITQFVPHRRHIVSATEPSRLMLCNIWGFRGGNYEECRLLGNKNPARTSQETHCISATK